jgi:hypothetical protein
MLWLLYPPEKSAEYLLYGRMNGSQSWSGHSSEVQMTKEQKNIFLSHGDGSEDVLRFSTKMAWILIV